MRKFLASVGNAKLLGKVNGEFQHIADIRTLTESTLSFSNTMEDVRAGQGAQLYGRFAHDSGMTVTLTDAMFDLDYVALQVGANLGGDINVDATGYHIDEDTINSNDSSGSIDLSYTPQPLGTACGLDHTIVWVKAKGCQDEVGWKAIELGKGATSVKKSDIRTALDKSTEKIDVCIEYFVSKPGNRAIQVKSNFIPAELILILTTQLFAGDANAPETGKPVGSITVKIPRFQLDGTFDLSMAMSSAATINLAGTALAVNDGTCQDGGVYAEIVEIIDSISPVDGLIDVIVDPDSVTSGRTPVVFGKYSNGTFSSIPKEYFKIYTATTFADLTFGSGTSETPVQGVENVLVVYDREIGLPISGKIIPDGITPGPDGLIETKQKYTIDNKTAYYYAVELTHKTGA